MLIGSNRVIGTRIKTRRLTRFLRGPALFLGLALALPWSASADVGRPGSDSGPTQVEVMMFLSDVDAVDGANQSFEANVFFELRWHDARLVHDDPSGFTRPLTEVWHPRLQLFNQQKVWKTFPDVVEVSRNGDVVYRQRVWGSFSQPLELRDFPFDRQLFEIQLIATGYSEDTVDLIVDPRSGIADRFSLPDWNIVH